MEIAVRELNNKEEWNNFIAEVKPDTFLQSWNWLETNKQHGESIVPLAAYSDEKLKGVAAGITVNAKRGKFLFAPHGPIVNGGLYQRKDVYTMLINGLISEARKRGLDFLRISPLLKKSPDSKDLYRELGFRPAPIHMHAETMWVLDITPDEDTLLKNMRKNTRNLIRRAGKEGVSVKIGQAEQLLRDFQELYKETAAREHFVAFSDDFLKTEFKEFAENDKLIGAVAEYNGEPVAAAIIPLCGNTGFYHQGASSRKYPKVPAAYLMHWEIIRELKRRSFSRYNFWGIAPDDAGQNHPWHGLSSFKKGFGGEKKEYLHAQDMPLKNTYYLTYIIETLRKKRRGL